MKTSVLQQVSDDSDTEDNISLTEDDYSILCKSDLPRTQIPNERGIENLDHSDKVELENDEDATSDVESEQIFTQKSENKLQKTTNIKWQKIVKKRSRSISPSRKKKTENSSTITTTNTVCSKADDIETNTQTNLNILNNEQFISNESPKKNSLNAENKMLAVDEKTVHAEDINSNEITCNAITVQEVINTNNESVPQNPTKNKISKVLHSDKEHRYKIPISPKKERLKEVKKNLTPLLDNVKDVQNTSDPCTSTNEPLDQNHAKLNIESDIENAESLEIQPSVIIKKHQPKDSGIEDTDEEFVEHDKKYESETQKVEQNLSTSLCNVEYKDDLVHVANDLKSKNLNSPKKVDPEDVPNINEKINTSEQEHQEKLQKPIIINIEIVNRKYKLIPDTSVLNKRIESEESSMKDFWNKRLYETEEIEENIEYGITPLIRKRLQQFRRLNLTTESDSSLSDNDITYSSENMREKLFNRDKEFDMSGSEDESTHYKHESMIQLLRLNKSEDTSESFPKESNYCMDNEDNSLTHCPKVEMNSCIDIKQSSFIDSESAKCKSNCSNNIVNHNADHEEDESCMESVHGKNLDIKITEQPVNKRTVTHRRPCNLEELIEQEGLVLKTPRPSFKFKDIKEDELFIIDLPSKVLENQLLGSKMVLTENKLKLGKQKYKINCKKIDNISCVFASTKLNKPYRTVNIKPLTRIVTREKIT
ncbi:uncharacterized protein LOC143428239 [Xylocopa sonorina]|uniref:uncharacterized protein LOC143428239 n=1 Tax=Xylocopa sonorina TaxID=1818115 RepID=UPI00403AF322